MAQPVHPHHGARFQIDRVDDHGDTAVYDATVLVDAGNVVFRATLGGDEATLVETMREPAELAPLPEWVDKHLRALLRQIERSAKRNGAWPRRLRRWRAEPNR